MSLLAKRSCWIIGFEGKKVSIKVKAGQKVAAGETLVEVEVVDRATISIGPQVAKWSEINKGALRHQLQGMKVSPGTHLVRGIESSVSGVIESIDEFMVAHILLESVHFQAITAPVKSVVKAVKKDTIELEFKAYEVPVVGLNEGKVWGDCQFVLLKTIVDIDFRKRGMVGIVDRFEKAMVTKAEVVGMAGLLLVGVEVENGTEVMTKVLLGTLSSAFFQQLMSKLGSESIFRVLLNTKVGRMLVAVQ